MDLNKKEHMYVFYHVVKQLSPYLENWRLETSSNGGC